jgi:hypothetical protein
MITLERIKKSPLTIKKARTQFKLFIEVKEKLPNKDLQN